MPQTKSVVLVPGLFSPRWHMRPLRRALGERGFAASIWDDASVFGELEDSIEKLKRRLGEQDGAVGVVTHSFGDWLFRQVAARGGAANVDSLVSLVPVMSSSFVARMLKPVAAIAPEIAVMASEHRAAAALEIPGSIHQLIIWSAVDPWVSRVDAGRLPNARSVEVAGTHNSILWQPGIHRMVGEHLAAADPAAG